MQYITTPHQAELNAEAVMKSWGFSDARATAGGSDGGIDVRSSRALAQVKWRGGVAGRPDLQRLYGARGADTTKLLFFFAASDYSKGAVQYADQVGIGLFIYDPAGAIRPANAVARRFMSSRGVQVDREPMWLRDQDLLILTGCAVAIIVGLLLLAALAAQVRL